MGVGQTKDLGWQWRGRRQQWRAAGAGCPGLRAASPARRAREARRQWTATRRGEADGGGRQGGPRLRPTVEGKARTAAEGSRVGVARRGGRRGAGVRRGGGGARGHGGGCGRGLGAARCVTARAQPRAWHGSGSGRGAAAVARRWRGHGRGGGTGKGGGVGGNVWLGREGEEERKGVGPLDISGLGARVTGAEPPGRSSTVPRSSAPASMAPS
ncbi:uncharacterized protein [Miscanthus floridulus]|uniref:uncharacterized protein n=1 Tax=Miscanthus floridulus TaxID=154761 RepID=UPI003459CC80